MTKLTLYPQVIYVNTAIGAKNESRTGYSNTDVNRGKQDTYLTFQQSSTKGTKELS